MADQDINTAFQTALDAGKIHGAIFSATDAEGNFLYHKTLGQRTLLSGEKKDLELDDINYLASATKLVTCIAALQCVEDGTLSLKGDLSMIAPDLAARKIITGFSQEDGKTPLLEPQTSPITLETLLTHSSGFTYHFMNPLIFKWRELSRNINDTRKRNVEELFDYPLAFQPGTDFAYGPGLDWAGRIVERVTDKTLSERMHERIFEPLGITDAQFVPVTREDLRARLIDLNPDDPKALGRAPLGGNADMNTSTRGDFGGHGLYMTAPDYVKILHSLLANDGKILKPSTANDMFEHHLGPEATIGQKQALEGPFGGPLRVGVAPGSKAGYGLGGLLTLQDVEGWYGERTLSWGGGLTFVWFVDRKNDICGVVAIQAALPVDGEVIESLKQTFRHDIYRERAKANVGRA